MPLIQWIQQNLAAAPSGGSLLPYRIGRGRVHGFRRWMGRVLLAAAREL